MTKSSSTFNGFQSGRERAAQIPAEFFDELLPAITHLAEMKVTLFCLWAFSQQQAKHPYLQLSDLLGQDELLRSLPAEGKSSKEALEEALERAVQRGTLLVAQAADDPSGERYYFLNGPAGKEALAAIRAGQWQPTVHGRPVRLKANRPNIFVLYEQNIGALTPMLAERLQEAEGEYPAGWIEQAIDIAVANNVRKWRYVEAILENWKTKGKDDEEDRRDLEETRRRYLGGEFAEYIEH